MSLQPIQSGELAITGDVGARELELRLVDVSAVASPFVATTEVLVTFYAWERRSGIISSMRNLLMDGRKFCRGFAKGKASKVSVYVIEIKIR